MVFKDACIVVTDSDSVIHTDQENVVNAWVLKVVKCCGHETTHLLQVIHLELLLHASFDAEVVESLANICRVSLVMISDILVAICKRPDEVHQIAEVDLATADKAVLRKHVWQQGLQLVAIS